MDEGRINEYSEVGSGCSSFSGISVRSRGFRRDITIEHRFGHFDFLPKQITSIEIEKLLK